ncbi:MAG: hypothetical protein K2N81_04050, partial [Acetatifactor sp.]|nr:hypothetical protein [Acetatifactor sp.]
LRHDFDIYTAMAILHGLLYLLCNGVHVFNFHPLVVFCVYLMALPFVLYHLGRTVYLLKLNREDEADYAEPIRLGELHDKKPEREPSYRMEQKKLICILTRYYLSRDTLSQIRRQITESDSCTMTSAELYGQLSRISFYEEVCPAQAFGTEKSNPMIFLMIISLVIGLLCVFRVWGII